MEERRCAFLKSASVRGIQRASWLACRLRRCVGGLEDVGVSEGALRFLSFLTGLDGMSELCIGMAWVVATGEVVMVCAGSRAGGTAAATGEVAAGEMIGAEAGVGAGAVGDVADEGVASVSFTDWNLSTLQALVVVWRRRLEAKLKRRPQCSQA